MNVLEPNTLRSPVRLVEVGMTMRDWYNYNRSQTIIWLQIYLAISLAYLGHPRTGH